MTILIVIIVFSNVSFAADLIYSSAYLNHPISAQVDAMGGISPSMPIGILNADFNPATRDSVSDLSYALSQVFDIQNARQNSLALGYNRSNFATRVYGFYGSVKDIEARSGPTDEPDYLFTARQMYLAFQCNYTPTEHLTIGAGIKMLDERIDLDRMTATAWDFGAVGRLYGFNLGLSVRNLGKSVKFQQSLYDLPLAYSAGLSRRWRFIVAEFYYNKPDLLAADYGLNAQFDVNRWLQFRSGIRLGHDSRLFSTGLVINYEGFSLAYSFVPLKNNLGIRHSLGLSYGLVN